MIENIFIRKYDKAEDKLTEAFVRLLACLEGPLLNNILNDLGIKDIGKNIIFKLQPKGDKSTPDAEISSNRFAIYVEVKRTSSLRLSQLRRHAQFLSRNLARFKLLLIISRDPYEIEEIKSQRTNLDEGNYVERFMTWTEIWHILHKLKNRSKVKDKFLLNQFADYLKEEKVVIMPKGFQKKDSTKWINFMEWSAGLDDMLFMVIKGYIKFLRPNWVYKSPYRRPNEFRLRFNTTNNSNKYLKFFSGFFVDNDKKRGWEDPCFYVGWELRSKHFKKIEHSHSQVFKNKENKLRKNRFIPYDSPRGFYRLIKIEDIAKKKTTEKQIQYIKWFIKDSVQKFNKIGLSKLI